MPENKKNYLWPDEDNTAIAYLYINGIPKVNEELLIKLDSTGDYLKRARNTYNLVGLGNLPMEKIEIDDLDKEIQLIKKH